MLIVNFRTAFYPFDTIDTLDKYLSSPMPLTRAGVRIIGATHEPNAVAMRAS